MRAELVDLQRGRVRLDLSKVAKVLPLVSFPTTSLRQGDRFRAMEPDPDPLPPARHRTLYERWQALEPEISAESVEIDLHAELAARGWPVDEDGYLVEGLDD